jgi:four helix bundle protein
MEKYRTLEAWRRAHATLLTVLRQTDAAYHPRSRALFDQIKRAAISIEANIVEGYALGTPAYFKKHLRIAMGSAAEAECLTRVAREIDYLSEVTTTEIIDGLGATMRTIRGLLSKPLAHPRTVKYHSPLPKRP